jgi:hypothetical protein
MLTPYGHSQEDGASARAEMLHYMLFHQLNLIANLPPEIELPTGWTGWSPILSCAQRVDKDPPLPSVWVAAASVLHAPVMGMFSF